MIPPMQLILMALGGKAPPVFGTLTPDTFATSVTDPANANVQLEVRTNGVLAEVNNGVDGTTQTWLTSGDPADCEVQCRTVSGTVLESGSDSPGAASVPTDGSWLTVDQLREWIQARNTVGSDATDITIEIREIANTANTTGQVAYTLGATVNP